MYLYSARSQNVIVLVISKVKLSLDLMSLAVKLRLFFLHDKVTKVGVIGQISTFSYLLLILVIQWIMDRSMPPCMHPSHPSTYP